MSIGITLIGIGNMGAALAHAFLKDGIKVTAWNRSANRANIKLVVDSGAQYEADVTRAISSNDVIVICVLDYAAIYELLKPLDAVTVVGGKSVINLTNGTPKQARELDSWFRKRGVTRYLDGAVMTTPQLIGTEHSFIVLSGETELIFDEISKQYLEPAGRCLYRGVDVGAASLFDVAALAPMYGMFTGLFIAIGLLSRQKLPVPEGSTADEDGERPKIAELVTKTFVPLMTAMAPYLGLISQSWDASTWDDSMGNTVGMQLEGLKNILLACEEEGVDGTGLEPIARLFDKIVRNHGGAGGIAVGGKYMLT